MFSKTIKNMLVVITLQFAMAGLSVAVASNIEERKSALILNAIHPDQLHRTSNSQAVARQLSQSRRGGLKSRSQVIEEVKRRYDAEILKISLDERQQVYRVRVLMKNGKVRNLQISARR